MADDDLLHRWPDAERILDPLLDLPEADRRERALAACDDDQALRRIVQQLLDLSTRDTGDDPRLPSSLLVGDTDSDAPAEAVPAAVGAYRILGELGRGGMSRVFRAVREGGPALAPVALKQLDRRPTSTALRRFDRERDTLTRLQHPHIARLLDGGVADDGLPYLVMELVEGEPIDVHCDRHGLDVAARLVLFRQVLAAVEFAHARLIVHRDIKPANVFVDTHGEVKLLDFGIAKWLDEAADPGLTEAQHRVLTPSHAAPEQFVGAPVTAATDVYQLGLLLYELLTGRRAHAPDASTHEALSRVVVEQDPPPPSEAVRLAAREDPAATETRLEAARRRGATTVQALSRRLTGDLDAIVLKALRKDPADRYASVEALRRDVDDYLASRPVSARRGTLLYAARKYASRHRAGVAAAATAALALVVGIGVVLAQSRVTAAERDRARQAEARATAINTFLVRDLLAAATPEAAQGRTLEVAEVLANASRSVRYAFAGQPGIEAEVRLTLAESYLSLGEPARAREHVDAALQAVVAAGPHDMLTALRGRALLGRVLAHEGRHEEARVLLAALVGDQQRQLGADHPDTLETLGTLASTLRGLGQLTDAESTAADALARASERRPDDWRLLTALRRELASIFVEQSRGIEAEALIGQVLADETRALGPNHPDVLASLATHADVLNQLLRYPEALAARQTIVERHRAVFGDHHPQTARALLGLAVAYDRLDQYDRALDTARQALVVFRKALGDRHPDTIDALRRVGVIHGLGRAFADAEPIYREVLSLRSAVLGPAHHDTIEAAGALSFLLARAGRPGDSRDAGVDVIRRCRQASSRASTDPVTLDRCATFFLDAPSPDLRDADEARRLATRATTSEGRRHYLRLRTLARAERALGDADSAIATLQEALALPQAIQSWTTEDELVTLMQAAGASAELEAWLTARLARMRELRGPDDRLLARTLRHLARLAFRDGRLGEAEQRYGEVLAQIRKTAPDSDWEIGRATSEMAEVVAARGAYGEAEALMLEGVRILSADVRTVPATLAAAQERLARLYEAWNRPTEAARWRQPPPPPVPAVAARP